MRSRKGEAREQSFKVSSATTMNASPKTNEFESKLRVNNLVFPDADDVSEKSIENTTEAKEAAVDDDEMPKASHLSLLPRKDLLFTAKAN
jgi:hypothetical protein